MARVPRWPSYAPQKATSLGAICANLAPHVLTMALPAAVLLGIILHSRVRVQGLSTWFGVYYVVAALSAGVANAATACAM